MDVKRTKVSNCCKGSVFAMVDKDPTGNYVRHNYLVMSNITDYTETVLCFGITTARKGKWDNMIPLSSSNDVDSYIDLNKVYEYKVHEFANGHYHGCVNDVNIMKILTQAMRLRVGLIDRNKIEEIKGRIDTVTVSLQDGVIIENTATVTKKAIKPTSVELKPEPTEPENKDGSTTATINGIIPLPSQEEINKILDRLGMVDQKLDETVAVMTDAAKEVKATSRRQKKPKVKTEQEKKRETLTGIFPFRTSSWSDEQLKLFVADYESGKYNACRAHITNANEEILLRRFEKACTELEKRGLRLKTTKPVKKEDEAEAKKVVKKEESKPVEKAVKVDKPEEKQEEKTKTFSQKAKRYSPSFWTKDELELFVELYDTEEGKSILKSEFGLTNAGLISKNSEVHRRLGKNSN